MAGSSSRPARKSTGRLRPTGNANASPATAAGPWCGKPARNSIWRASPSTGRKTPTAKAGASPMAAPDLRGQVLKTDNLAELKLFAATLLSGAASALTVNQQTIYGSQLCPHTAKRPTQGRTGCLGRVRAADPRHDPARRILRARAGGKGILPVRHADHRQVRCRPRRYSLRRRPKQPMNHQRTVVPLLSHRNQPMKTIYLIPLLLLSACASNRTPTMLNMSRPVPGTTLPERRHRVGALLRKHQGVQHRSLR